MRDCCEKPENREKPVRLSDDLIVSLCRVCGAKHYEMEVDPAKLLTVGSEL